MNRQVRRIALIVLVLYGVVYLNLNRIQLVQAEKLANDPRNVRLLYKEYSTERGAIVSADGKTLAQSKPTPEETLKYLREYPTGPLFAHTVGYYSVVFGRDRIERSYNKALTGEGGVLTMQDIGDRFLGKGHPGDTVELSIDSTVQQAATNALGKRKGGVVAIDPATGEILAMVSYPSFDPNPVSGHNSGDINNAWDALQNDPAKPLLNRATNESYPPGSTFKVVTAAAALEHGRTTATSYPVQAEYTPPQTNKSIANFGNRPCGGDLAAALRVSCNTYFAHLGADLAAVIEYAVASLRVSDIVICGHTRCGGIAAIDSGIEDHYIADWLLIANGAKVPKPKLVKRVRDFRGVKVETFQPEVWKEAISKETADTLTGLMVDVVDKGTGAAAAIPGVKVAGKTGTAQTREGEAPHAWFICFAPADHPRIAVAVVVENGGDVGNEATGGKLAAPIAKAVLEAHRKVGLW